MSQVQVQVSRVANVWVNGIYTLISSLSIAYNLIVIYAVLDVFKPTWDYFWDAVVYTGFVMSIWGVVLHLAGIGTACNGEKSPYALVRFVKFSYIVHISILTFGIVTFIAIALFTDNHERRENMIFYLVLIAPGAICLYPAWLLYVLAIMPTQVLSSYAALHPYVPGYLYVTAP